MMRLKNRDIGVPGFFRYTHEETHHRSFAQNWFGWKDAIFAHRRANNLPIPGNMMDIAEDQLCRQLDPDWCERSEKDANSINTQLSIWEIIEGATAYAKLFGKKLLGIGETVSQEEANRRANICGGCYLRVYPQGCGACTQLAEMISGDVSKLKTDFDAELEMRACAVCKCPLKPLVHFPMSVLEEHDTPEKQALYPKDFCWRSKLSPNYAEAA